MEDATKKYQKSCRVTKLHESDNASWVNDLLVDDIGLLKTASANVCSIYWVEDNKEEIHKGTGFMIGNGWVLTNQHVVCFNEEKSDIERMKFVFPEITYEPKERLVYFAYFDNPPNVELAMHDIGADLALIKLENDTPKGIGTIQTKQPIINEPVYMIHYGDLFGIEKPPQQLSYGNVSFNIRNDSNLLFTVHTCHSREGASGAPLLRVSNDTVEVIGVNFSGTCVGNVLIDCPSYSLTWNETVQNKFLQNAQFFKTFYDREIDSNFKKLNQLLQEAKMRLRFPVQKPENVENCDHIIWKL